MENAAVMRGGESFQRLDRNIKETVEGKRGVETMSEVLSFDKLHDQKRFAVVLKHIVHGSKMFIDDARSALGFLEESFTIMRVCTPLRRDALQSDVAFQNGVFSAIDLTHSAVAETLADD